MSLDQVGEVPSSPLINTNKLSSLGVATECGESVLPTQFVSGLETPCGLTDPDGIPRRILAR
jgi:hypothetical protein